MKRYSISTHEIIAVAFLVGSFNFLSAILDFVAFSNFRFVGSIGYYGLALNVGNLVRDLYINNFVGGLVELPAYLLLFVCLKVGRKWPYIVLMAIGGTSLVISAFLIVYIQGKGWRTSQLQITTVDFKKESQCL